MKESEREVKMLNKFLLESLNLNDNHTVPGTPTELHGTDQDGSWGQLYVAMLSISLIVGLAYCSYVIYKYWFKGRALLSLVMTLAVSHLLRTFFKLLLCALFIIGESTDVAGFNTLVAFECFFLNMTYAYWLLLTIYLHEYVESSFNNEPSIKLFRYGVPGVAAFFALIWIFIMSGAHYDWAVSILNSPAYLWINNILLLLYICIQFGLTFNMGGMIITRKSTYDTDCIALLKKSSFVYFGLFILYWFDFGFMIGDTPNTNETFKYFNGLVDGLQCAIACPLLFFLEKWGQQILDKVPRSPPLKAVTVSGLQTTPKKPQEFLIKEPHQRKISTIQSTYGTKIEGTPETESRDIVYSNVVAPERLQKTFDLYKRLGAFPINSDVTVVTGEKFYECREDDAKTVYNDCISKASDNLESDGGAPDAGNKYLENLRKKNAFYASKYLVVDPDEKNAFPRHLETRPPNNSNSTETKDQGQEQKGNTQSNEMVEKWLEKNSENMKSE